MKAPILIFSLITTTFCLFLQPNPSLSAAVNHQFEACRNPKTCGHQNFSFPFYIAGVQQPYCGYPGFAITCSDDRPLLNLSNTDYLIHDVVYANQSLRVSNAAVSDPATLCNTSPASLRNLTLNPILFQLYPNVTTLYLLYNCGARSNVSSSADLGRYGIGCSGVLGMMEGDSGEGDAFRACESVVEVPVEARGNGSDRREIGEVIGDGFVMTWTASGCGKCEKSGGRCGFDRQSFHFQCFCPDRPHACCCNSKGKKGMLIGLGVGGIGGLAVIVLFLAIYMFRHRRKYKSTLSQNSSAEDSFGGSNVYFEVPIFSNDELEQATNNFDSSKELGDGGYGTVYYGKLRDGREVAVKRLYEHNYRRVKQFMTEVQILTRLRHTNLVSLYGCTSRRSRELLLVYEYVANGTVADHLHGDRAKPGSFPWPLRMNIAVETAKALAYLHKEGIIHRDVKTTNILLDKNFSVKVGDFGISRLRPTDATHVSTAPQGTPGYVDPEYHLCYQLTEKSDVYSFGVVLVELVSSMPAVDISRDRHEINLANLAVNKIQKRELDELIDPKLNCESDDKIKSMVTAVIELSFRCLQQDRELRPTMDEVVEELENAVENGRVAESRDPIVRQSNVSVDAGKAKTTGFLTSPESDEAVLLNKVKFSSSPISVIMQNWTSSSSSINSKSTLSTL